MIALLALLLSFGQAAPAPAQQAAPAPQTAPAAPQVPILPVTIVARHPHDANAFSQGLIWHDGALYESLGQPGRSEVRRVDLATGKVLARSAIPPAQFGEGLAAWRDQLISLTWHDGVAHRWRARDLKRLGQFRYTGEGWGLAADATALYLSDGTDAIRVLDPATFAERRRIPVTLRGGPLDQLNELEVIDGRLYANVWHTPYLVRIDPATGQVDAIVDLRPLVREVAAADPEAVANGIAWDAKGRRLFVTGKLWPTLFEVRLP
jgi:glutamine cyclotransferase